ncbi:MAG: DUF932 domain-containing protein [Candidatus Schekmanbacteria bacterium]|nr:MAG: DUF932 domain-containing protein [Candidatus Schekmanbacteria bacterium]
MTNFQSMGRRIGGLGMMNFQSMERNKRLKRWSGLPVIFHKGTLEYIMGKIPDFERKPFSADGMNKFYDVIVRKPMNGEGEIPVGIVSKSYSLIQHRDILTLVIDSFKNIPHFNETEFRMFMTPYGERIEFLMILPSKYHFDPGDGHKVGFSFWCRNSVDGSTKLSLLFGWLRLICSNGMVVFDPKSLMDERRHTKSLDQYYVNNLIIKGFAAYEKEKKVLEQLYKTPLNKCAFERWINVSVKEKWGVKAAVRTYHIAMSGRDVNVVPPNKKEPPTKKKVKYTDEVPGAVAPANNFYAVVQALSWLARQRRDIDEQFQWSAQIPALIDDYLKIAA